MNFECTACDYADDDKRLQLVVKDGVTHSFYINPDGTLEHYDSEGNGQEMYLECPLCGQKYEFVKEESLELQKIFMLVKYPDERFERTDPTTLDDLKFEKKVE